MIVLAGRHSEQCRESNCCVERGINGVKEIIKRRTSTCIIYTTQDSCDDDAQAEIMPKKDSCDKKNWLSSTQLWNTNENVGQKANAAAQLIKKKAEEEDAGRAFCSPGIKNPMMGNGLLTEINVASRLIPCSIPNVQSGGTVPTPPHQQTTTWRFTRYDFMGASPILPPHQNNQHQPSACLFSQRRKQTDCNWFFVCIPSFSALQQVQDFLYVLVEEDKRLVAYLDDLYEDSRGNKMAVVRWFHKVDEVGLDLLHSYNDRDFLFALSSRSLHRVHRWTGNCS